MADQTVGGAVTLMAFITMAAFTVWFGNFMLHTIDILYKPAIKQWIQTKPLNIKGGDQPVNSKQQKKGVSDDDDAYLALIEEELKILRELRLNNRLRETKLKLPKIKDSVHVTKDMDLKQRSSVNVELSKKTIDKSTQDDLSELKLALTQNEIEQACDKMKPSVKNSEGFELQEMQLTSQPQLHHQVQGEETACKQLRLQKPEPDTSQGHHLVRPEIADPIQRGSCSAIWWWQQQPVPLKSTLYSLDVSFCSSIEIETPKN